MSSGVMRIATGSYLGTGAAQNIATGFQPGEISFFNQQALANAFWHQPMPIASVVQRVTAGTLTFPTTQGVTPTTNGFNIGTNAIINGNGQRIFYIAREIPREG